MANAPQAHMPFLEELDPRKRKLFYSENPLELVADLQKIFEKYLDSIQIYNKVVQGTPIPHIIEFYSLLKEFQKGLI